jgi:hypothetical protein
MWSDSSNLVVQDVNGKDLGLSNQDGQPQLRETPDAAAFPLKIIQAAPSSLGGAPRSRAPAEQPKEPMKVMPTSAAPQAPVFPPSYAPGLPPPGLGGPPAQAFPDPPAYSVEPPLPLPGMGGGINQFFYPRVSWDLVRAEDFNLEVAERKAIEQKHVLDTYLLQCLQAKTVNYQAQQQALLQADLAAPLEAPSIKKQLTQMTWINPVTKKQVWKGENGTWKNRFYCSCPLPNGMYCGKEQQCENCIKYELTLTTVMFKNIPNDFSRDKFLNILKRFDLTSDHYDFVYLPMDFSRGAGYGYAFVNFTAHEHAIRAYDALAGFNEWEANGRQVKSSKQLELTWGDRQGREDNTRHYSKSPVMHATRKLEEQPVIFIDGEMHSLGTDGSSKIRKPRIKPKIPQSY